MAILSTPVFVAGSVYSGFSGIVAASWAEVEGAIGYEVCWSLDRAAWFQEKSAITGNNGQFQFVVPIGYLFHGQTVYLRARAIAGSGNTDSEWSAPLEIVVDNDSLVPWEPLSQSLSSLGTGYGVRLTASSSSIGFKILRYQRDTQGIYQYVGQVNLNATSTTSGGVTTFTETGDIESEERLYGAALAAVGIANPYGNYGFYPGFYSDLIPPILSAINITGNSAEIRILPNGLSTQYDLQWSESPTFLNAPTVIVTDDLNGIVSFLSATLNGLDPETTYYVRCRARSPDLNVYHDSEWSDTLEFITDNTVELDIMGFILRNNVGLDATPTDANHLANKGYVDSVVTGLNLPTTYAPAEHTHSAADITVGTLAAARLPLATASEFGAVKIGTGLTVTSGVVAVGDLSATYALKSHAHAATEITSGTLNAARLPIATASALGGVKIGAGLTITSGVLAVGDISATYAVKVHSHTLSQITDAGTAAAAGLVTSVASTATDAQVPSAKAVYDWATVAFAPSTHNHAASAINSGTLDAARLPLATASVFGAVKIGTGIAVSNGVISVGDLAGTYAAKVHTHTLSQITDAGNVPILDAGGKLPYSVLPSMAIGGEKFTAASETAMIGLSEAGPGDYCYRSDTESYWVLGSPAVGGYATASNWFEVASKIGDKVTSISSESTDAQVPTAKAVYTYAAPVIHNHTAAQITSGTIASARLPKGTASVLGAVKIGTGIGVTNDGVISVGDLSGTYAVKVHSHTLSQITDAGTAAALSFSAYIGNSSTDQQLATAKGVFDFSRNATNLTTGTIPAARLPAATASDLGAVKVPTTQSGITLTSGALSLNFNTLATTSDLIDTTRPVAIATVATWAAGQFKSLDWQPGSITASDGAVFSAPVFDPDSDSYLVPQNSVASLFSSSATYDVGDYVVYQGCLYRCVTAVSTAGAWSAAKWTAVRILDEMAAIRASDQYDGTITGDGTTKQFTISHNLGVKHVFFQLVDADDNLNLIPVLFLSTTQLKIEFANAPASGTVYHVIIRR